MSGRRLFRDIAAEHGFAGSYQSVKRFVRLLGQTVIRRQFGEASDARCAELIVLARPSRRPYH
jgi:hypothetical protein